MNAEHIDTLSRQVARQSDRRGLLKGAAGSALALLGLGRRERTAAASTGFEGDSCLSGADCREGLVCAGNSTGLLGGTLAGTPYGPGLSLPLLTGKTGRCRYHTEGCGREDQVCQNNDDCCAGFSCPNNRCRRD